MARQKEIKEVVLEVAKEIKFLVISRLNHPVEIVYNGESFMLPPRGSREIKNDILIKNLPNGCYLRKIV